MNEKALFDNSDPVFRMAYEFVNSTSQHIFLTGKAGTGKTTFLRFIKEKSHKNVIVAAPTGVAAINAGGVTLHSLFQLPFEPYIPNSRIKDTYKFGKAKQDVIRQAELLIIDEVSMLRADTLDSIDARLRFVRRNNEPFGGIQMLYIGDMFQLPPVVKDGEWKLLSDYYPTSFFFHAKVLEKVPPLYLELKTVYRQQDRFFVDLLNKVRNNELTNTDLETLNSRYAPYFEATGEEKYITLCTHNYQADRINAKKIAEIDKKSCFFDGEISGDFPEWALPTDMKLELKEGAQIMFIKNDLQTPRRYYNGKIAEITRINGDDIYVVPEGEEEEFVIEKELWRNVRYTLNKERQEIEEEELGNFKQYPIRLAWAITIHKSQGLTFQRAIIDAEMAFAAGQAYVALSRCTSLDGIVLKSKINSHCIQTDAHAIAFSKNDKPIELLHGHLSEAKKLYWAERLIQYFDWKPLLNMLREFKRFTEDRISDELQSAHEISEQLYINALQQQDVARQFQKQLRHITQSSASEEEKLTKLKERCTKAVVYFYNDIFNLILKPLQEHRDGFTKMKKAKVYWKRLNELCDDIVFFTKKLSGVRYNDLALIDEATELPALRPPAKAEEKAIKPPKKERPPKDEKSPKAKKGDTQRATLELFKTGKTIPQIASERNLTVQTISTHLAGFIKTGDIDVLELVSEEKLQAMIPPLQEAIEKNELSLSPIKQQLGDDFSYAELRAGMEYCLTMKEMEDEL